MVLTDPLADSMSKLDNASKSLSKSVKLKKNKFLLEILKLLQRNSYVGEIEEVLDSVQGSLVVNLVGTINSCGVVKPRFPVSVEELEKYEQRFLPAKDFGVIILSTNKGLLTQKEAKEENIGGRLIAYCY